MSILSLLTQRLLLNSFSGKLRAEQIQDQPMMD